ncbi:MAG: extracellular solute-binding protein [Mesorhizobium sp.]|nr:MAG: extracellular solute-binding protein [Mesorhizobium sp.]RWO75384.1 MAG: extracellular solute-binding protein [Mesorhizobium sp.]
MGGFSRIVKSNNHVTPEENSMTMARLFTAAAMAISCLFVATVVHPTMAVSEPAKKFIVGDSGGASHDASVEAFFEPFTERTGVQIDYVSPTSFGKLRAMVESGNVTASLWDMNSQTLEQAVSLGLLEKLNWKLINPLPIFPETRQDYAFGQSYFSTGMAWKKGTQPIESWADFWNVEKFPGKRCLRDEPESVLPAALMADGVPLDKIYPLDVDRAFRSLERIAPNVSVWWTSGQQAATLLADNEVAYCMAWNGRIMPRPELEFNYNQALLDIAWWVVPKGAPAPEVEAAMLALHDWTVPEKQALQAERVFYPGNSPQMAQYLPEQLKDKMPTSPKNKDRQLLSNGKWWFENGDAVAQRWQEWKLAR